MRRSLRADEFDAALYLVSPTQEIVDAGKGSLWWRSGSPPRQIRGSASCGRRREAGDAEGMGWAVNYLRDFGVFSGSLAYAQALERLR